MNFKTNIALGGLLLLCIFATAQTTPPRRLPANRISVPVKIDGLLNDSAWKSAAMMTDLVEFRPKVGAKENYENRTETYLMYSDEGIYFGGYCYERTRDSIATELSGRDGFGTNDYIGLILDTYHDKINGFEYFVTPLNEQWDSKMSPGDGNNGGEDFSWNAVWESGAVIHDNGWSFEMFIPFSAIRFSKKEVQTWGLNITRRRRKTEQQYTWNPIDPNVNGFLTQEGTWEGITNIKPPLRLQFSPYLSTYANHFPQRTPGVKDWTSSVNGGMDVKYGINQAFTLDATLVPDFGQVQSDNRVLNLTPFEVRYQENRPFFTEGTELFNKSGLFYPRRIGIDPILTHSVDEYMTNTDRILKNPVESKLINATKISGRTSKGLGIGVLNAVTNNRYASLENTSDLKQRDVLIDPLTNYNIMVLDQSLKHNSSITFTNMNVWRSGSEYDANVSAAQFSLYDKKNTWNVSGKLAMSMLSGAGITKDNRRGYGHSFSFGKSSGRFTFNVKQDLIDRKFRGNDLGYFTTTNQIEHYAYAGYNWLKPTRWYNRMFFNFNFYHSYRLMNPAGFQGINVNMNMNGQLKNLWYVGGMAGYEPKANNYYEPRIEGRYFRGWSNYFFSGWFETNYAKKYGFSFQAMMIDRSLFNSKRYSLDISNRYRFNNKLTISHSLSLNPQKRNAGFAAFDGDKIVFGKRDIEVVDNTIGIKYSFNSKMNINTRIRHYWSQVHYDQYFTLRGDGSLARYDSYTGNADYNINFFNIDMVYTWQFAPGSFLNVVWKNAASSGNQDVAGDYFKNVRHTMQADDNNNLSLKVIYFLDYLQLKKHKKKVL